MWPLDMYGQESKWGDMILWENGICILIRFAVDSVKYPIGGYQNPVIFTNPGVTFQFKKGGPFLQTKVLYIKGI